LVAIEHAFQASKRALWASLDPRIAADQDRESALAALLNDLYREAKAIRKDALARVETPEITARIDVAKTKQHEVWSRLKTVRAATLRTHSQAFDDLNQERHEQLTAARRQTPLWWGNYNAVEASFDEATRRLGPGENLRAREGLQPRGRLTNQIQGGLRWSDFVTAGHAQVRLGPAAHLTNGRQRRQWRVLSFTVRTNPDKRRSDPDYRVMVTLPVCLHRPIPDDAIIKTVTVTRDRRVLWSHLGGDKPQPNHWKWHVVFVVVEPETETQPGIVAGVDIGWRKFPDGIRVATICGADGSRRHYIVPLTWIDDRQRQAERLGILRKNFNNQLTARPDLVNSEHPRVSDLVKASWQVGDPALDEWRRNDRRERYSVNNRITRLNRQRQHLYRIWAKEIAEQFGTVAIDGNSIKQMAEAKVQRPMARQRTLCAVSELVAEISRAVKAAGGIVLKVKGRSTQQCHRCGHINNLTQQQRLDLIWRCRVCGDLWDQDINAAINLLDFAAGRASGLVASEPTNKPKRARRIRRAENDTAHTTAAKVLAGAEG
jgi:rubrerythrin